MSHIHSFQVRSLMDEPIVIRIAAIDSDDVEDLPIFAFELAANQRIEDEQLPPSVCVALRDLQFRSLDLALDAGARLFAACGEGADMELERQGLPVLFDDLIAADQELA
jgi:hypothetical protein